MTTTWYSDWFKDLCLIATNAEQAHPGIPHAGVLAILEHLGLCDICGQPVCPECKVCIACGGDGHAEGCSREGDEYTPEQRVEIERESVADALENDRCGICLSVDHFREDCPKGTDPNADPDWYVRERAEHGALLRMED